MSGIEKYKILIVDDQKTNIMALMKILCDDYELIVASDGIKAIERAKKYLPDLILLDIIMPQMDGFTVLARLREYESTKNIPIIFITGLHDTKNEERGFTLGAVDYIAKPFQDSIVKLRVNTQIKIIGYVRTIERLSMIDVLTDLPNRRSFDNRLRLEWSRAVREKTDTSVMMIDVDKFKTYNDTYGHMQGDLLLQTVAGIFKQTLKRSTDLAARWGGEEFIVLLPDTDSRGALFVAEEIRKKTEGTTILCADKTATSVTVSIGINTRIPTIGSDPDKFIDEADKALYQAKNSGRNRVCIAG